MKTDYALHDAIQQNQPECVIKYLIDHQNIEEICKPDGQGTFPLHLAISTGLSISIIHLLLCKGAFGVINKKDGDGYAPLHLAIIRLSRGNGTVDADTVRDLVHLLLSCGAEVNLPVTSANNTPLHLAAIEGDATIINTLLYNSADPLLKNNVEEMAKDLAQCSKARQILEKATEDKINDNWNRYNRHDAYNRNIFKYVTPFCIKIV